MDKFKIEPHKGGWEKSFEIITPESWAITLIVDYDDVDHKRVDKEAKKIVDILNNNSIPIEPPVKPATCGTCKHFVSYRVDYEDELEPDDCGFCKHPKEGIDHTTIEDTCNLHEPSKLSV